MIAVTYEIELIQPVLATIPGGDPNSNVSLPYIPGSLIRGVAGARMHRSGDFQDLSIDARALLFSAQTRFLNAYPLDQAKGRALPVPFTWQRDKDSSKNRVEDSTLTTADESELCTPKSMSGQMWLTESQVEKGPTHIAHLYEPQWQIAGHIRRDPKAGRPRQYQGAVFRYEALAAGQCFSGAVVVDSEERADELMLYLYDGPAYIGGSRSAGYGHVELRGVTKKSNWHEVSPPANGIPAGAPFTVTLLSNLQLRNECGMSHLNLSRSLKEEYQLDVGAVESFIQTEVVGGFSQVWGMPLPQERTLKPGSVFVLSAGKEIPLASILDMMDKGIGERRAEGFGCIALNWPNIDELICQKAEAPTDSPTSYRLPDDSPAHIEQLAIRMATRRRRQELDNALIKAINDHTISRAPTNAQLARIRTLVRNAEAQNDLTRIGLLFKKEIPIQDESIDTEHEQKPSEHSITTAENPVVLRGNALKKFQAARISGKRLTDWIEKLADDPETVWQVMKVSTAARSLGGQPPDETGLAREYAARLIDGVLGKQMDKRRASDARIGAGQSGERS